MAEKRNLGRILLESGRVTEEEIEEALEHQRLHGGFFGQALIALGLVTREEIDWALASQFDIPFIFPRPEAVDRDAAALVAGDWALAHLAVPIVRTGVALTVVCADPLQQEAFDELRARTGYEIELALASSARIRELIEYLYGAGQDDGDDEYAPLPVAEFFARALERHAERFGISVRGRGAWGWFSEESVHRRPLTDAWEAALPEALQPFPPERSADGGLVAWTATLKQPGYTVAVEAQALVGAGGAEYLFRPRYAGDVGRAIARGAALPPPIVAELRLLARAGSARIVVAGEEPELARALLPLLPGFVRPDGLRAVHLSDDGELPGVCTLRPSEDVLEALPSFRFDALTLDLPSDEFPVADLLGAAPLSFVFLREGDWRSRLPQLEIGWILAPARSDRGEISWTLSATT
ncbi:MAG TPA: hypothetical protein VFQ38_23110 [Longimicrobiales bacterium]|nr:hypothetical protein [Longimicrobiales bacterium]